MQKKVSLALTTSALLVFSASMASAVISVDVNVAGIFTDTTFVTPVGGAVIDPSGDEATVGLVAGQGILLSIDIANLNGDFVQDLISTIIFQGDQMTYLGGSYTTSSILIGGPISAQTSLASIGAPRIKSDGPNAQGDAADVWLQSTVYVSLGTDGTGPNIDAVRLFFEVTGASGADQIDFFLTKTAGDIISGIPILNGAVINPIPEPGTALLMGLGLAGLAAAGRRRS